MKEAALKYLEAVQAEFQHDTIKLDAFKKMLKEYKDEKIDIGGIKVRAKGLFKEHKHLISGFNTFLPKEHQITPNLGHEDSSAFLKAVKDAFQDNTENVDEFLHIHCEWKYKIVDKKSIMARMKELLKEHIDLYFGYEAFVSQSEYSATTGNQFKGDASRVCCSNNRYVDVSECKDNFEKKRSKRSKRRDFSRIIEYIVESKNRKDVVVCGYNEGFEKLTPKKRRSNTSHRVEFETNTNEAFVSQSEYSATTSNQFKGDDSKKKIMKRKAENERSNTPSKKLKINNNNNNDNDRLQEEQPELPLEFKEKIEQMEGSDVMLVMQKKLTKTDVNANNNRLSIPKTERITDKFLTSEEKSSLDYVRGKHEDCHTMHVSVLDPRFVLDPKVTLYDGMGFTKWKMVKSETYNITGEWKDLVAENQLKEGQKVQLWSFRSHRKLCFALVKL